MSYCLNFLGLDLDLEHLGVLSSEVPRTESIQGFVNVRQTLPAECNQNSHWFSKITWSNSGAFEKSVHLEGGAKDEKLRSLAHSIPAFVLSGSLLAGSAKVPARGRGSVTHA